MCQPKIFLSRSKYLEALCFPFFLLGKHAGEASALVPPRSSPNLAARDSRRILERNVLMNCSGPCDVWIPGSSLGASRLTGAEAAAWLRTHAANQNARLTVRPWEASTSDHEALRDYQVYLIEGGRGLLPF
jgi:hypothetical protein